MIKLLLFFLITIPIAAHTVYVTDPDEIIAKEIQLAIERFKIKEKFTFFLINDKASLSHKLDVKPGTIFGDVEANFLKNKSDKTEFTFHSKTLKETLREKTVKVGTLTIIGRLEQSQLLKNELARFSCYNEELQRFSLLNQSKFTSSRITCINVQRAEPHILIIFNEESKGFPNIKQEIEEWKNAYIHKLEFQNQGFNQISISLQPNVELLSNPFLNNHSMPKTDLTFSSQNLSNENTLTIISLNETIDKVKLIGLRNQHYMETTSISFSRGSHFSYWYAFLIPLLPLGLYLKKFIKRKKYRVCIYSTRLAEGQTISRSDLPAAMQAIIPEFKLFNLAGKIISHENSHFGDMANKWKNHGLTVKIIDEKFKNLTGDVNKSYKLKFQL